MKRRALTARTADKFALYETSVQSPALEVDFIERSFRKVRGRAALSAREDFCGSASFACEWVKRADSHKALGLDLDAHVLRWAKEHHLQTLDRATRSRVELRRQDVLVATRERFDVCVAFNYSYSVFKTRDALRAYFKQARRALVPDGILYLDLLGGALVQQTCVDTHTLPGFSYVWEQAAYNPIDASFLCHIHFRFPDGSRINRAFTYDWRLWTLPELRELLGEAGFSSSAVYWEDSNKRGEPTGKFRERSSAVNDLSWNAYILALR